jgi:bacteriorhodopsin
MLWNTFKNEAAKDAARDALYTKLMSLTVITWIAYPVPHIAAHTRFPVHWQRPWIAE